MLLKYVICEVAPHKQEAFSSQQSSWNDLSQVSGFLGQAGGWDNTHVKKAHIISLWENEDHYQSFMENHHDAIYAHSNQAESISTIAVELFKISVPIHGLSDELTAFLHKSSFIRVAQSFIKPFKQALFTEKQKHLWNPRMASTKAMISGVFGESCRTNRLFITVTGWTSENEHDSYQLNLLPSLKAQAKTRDDIESIERAAFLPVDDWTVTPTFL
ncbi:YdbC family protein [Shouchella patagoniensis]|uniref:YdbC family protein n=1 Tax=Shouchella patagoniensis TaxID=228576 RepID=UPI0014747B84|nr:YdbC family protein [Shouchella patagoniensis]